MDKERAKYFLDEAISMKNDIRPIYNEVLDLTDPFATISDDGTSKLGSQRDVDSDVLDNIDALVSFIMSSVLSRSGKWAEIGIDEIGMKQETANIKGNINETTRKIEEINKLLGSDTDKVFKFIQSSNYYKEISKAMQSFVRLGTGAYAIRETGVASKPFRFEYVGLDNLYILEDSSSNPSIVFKRYGEISGEKIMDLFGRDCKLPPNISDDPFKSISIYEGVIPTYDEKNARTVYNYFIITEDFETVILDKDLLYNPYVIFRWEVIEGSPWGRSIVLSNKSLLVELESYKEIYKAQAQKLANPATIFYGGSDLFNQLDTSQGVSNYGGDPTSGLSSASIQTIGGQVQLMPLDKQITDCRQRFKSILMVNQIGMNAVDTKYSSATAISITHELFRQRFSGTYELINSELLEPTIKSPFIIMLKSKSLELDESVFPYTTFEYVNELSQSNNINDVTKLLSYAEQIARLKEFNKMGVAVDMPKSNIYIAKKIGIPVDLIPTEEQLVEIQQMEKEALQQQLQQQQMLGSMNQVQSQDSGGEQV